MKKRTSLVLLVGVFVGGILLAGCGQKEPETPTGPPKEAMQNMKEQGDKARPGGK